MDNIEGHVVEISESESVTRVSIRTHREYVSDVTLYVKPPDTDKFFKDQVIVIVLGPKPETPS